MSAQEKVVEVRATEVPGMRVTFQGPLSPDGLGIAFEAAVDSTTSRADLDELLDRIGGARRRQAAIEELPIVQQSLHANRELLKTARREKAAHEARMGGRIATLSGKRRSEVMPNMQDQNALAQHDNRILQIEEQIERAKARIPYLEALRDGKEPPDPWPVVNDRMAAE